MSLINDALKKARFDADRQEAVNRGNLYDAAPSHVPARKRARVALAIGTLIAAVVLVTQIQRLATQRLATQEVPSSDSAGSETAEGAVKVSAPRQAGAARTADRGAEPSLDVAVLPAEPEPKDEAPVAEQRPPHARQERSPDPLGAARRRSSALPEPIPTAAVESESVEPIPARPTSSRPDRQNRQIPARPSGQSQDEPRAIDSLDGKSFLKKVRVPGGANLELSGIAWSDVHPVAVISGSIVGTGDFVDGFKVVKIEPNSVELQGEDSTFSIRLR